MINEIECYVRTGFEYDLFKEKLMSAQRENDIYYPVAFNELSIMKEWGYTLTSSQVWGDTDPLIQYILKYHSLMVGDINRWQAKQLEKRTTSDNIPRQVRR